MTTLTPSEQSALDPIDYIRGEMLSRRLKRSDLEHAFGSRSKTSDVLNRKRGLSLAMIRRLVFDHGFDAEKLIGGDYDFRNKKTDDALSKLEAGTHVLVPVKTTEAMEVAFKEAQVAARNFISGGDDDWWLILLQASQEDGR